MAAGYGSMTCAGICAAGLPIPAMKPVKEATVDVSNPPEPWPSHGL
jgi:hypothetical protein